jgi:peptidoglycan/LPS O-acetylase OafA/YrhL
MPDKPTDTPVAGERGHKPELDGIRGLAILLVLGSHAAGLLIAHLLVPGWGGVDLFFVLSGFLITGILLRTRDSTHYFRSFYARRVLRIAPVYYLTLVVTLLAGCFVPGLRALLPPTFLSTASYFVYLSNFPVFWETRFVMSGVWGIYWSLAVEEQFYTVWPLLVRLLTARAMLLLCIVGFLLELPLRLLLMHLYFGVHVGAIQITPDRADGLFAGAAVALYMHIYKRLVPLPWIATAAACGSAILLYIILRYPNDLVGNGHLYTIGITAFALLGGSLVAWSQYHPPRLQRFLTLRALRAAGKYSYGMYVYHLLLFVALRHEVLLHFPQKGDGLPLGWALLVMATGALATLLVAKLSYDLFESRFLALKRFFPASGTV